MRFCGILTEIAKRQHGNKTKKNKPITKQNNNNMMEIKMKIQNLKKMKYTGVFLQDFSLTFFIYYFYFIGHAIMPVKIKSLHVAYNNFHFYR